MAAAESSRGPARNGLKIPIRSSAPQQVGISTAWVRATGANNNSAHQTPGSAVGQRPLFMGGGWGAVGGRLGGGQGLGPGQACDTFVFTMGTKRLFSLT